MTNQPEHPDGGGAVEQPAATRGGMPEFVRPPAPAPPAPVLPAPAPPAPLAATGVGSHARAVPVVSTAPAVQPPTWSGKKTAVAAALAIGFAGVGAVAAAALPAQSAQSGPLVGPGPQGGGFGGQVVPEGSSRDGTPGDPRSRGGDPGGPRAGTGQQRGTTVPDGIQPGGPAPDRSLPWRSSASLGAGTAT